MSRNTIKDIDGYYEREDVIVCPDRHNGKCLGSLCIDCDRCEVHCKCNAYYYDDLTEEWYDYYKQFARKWEETHANVR